MLNSHHILSTEDIKKFKEIKDSTMYSDYTQGVFKSPIFSAIATEHIDDVNIASDIQKLQELKATPEQYNNVFKSTLRNIAHRTIADTIMLKEIVDTSIEDTKSQLIDNFKAKYILGLADKECYDEAEKILKKSPNPDSLLFRGLSEYNKKHDKTSKKNDGVSKLIKTKKTKTLPPIVQESESKSLTIDANQLNFQTI